MLNRLYKATSRRAFASTSSLSQIQPVANHESIKHSPNDIRSQTKSPPNFDIKALAYVLDHDNHENRNNMRKYLSNPDLQPQYAIPFQKERELSLKRLQDFCDNKLISVTDFKTNPFRIFAAHEIMAMIDPATAVKMTVQFNLFGGTVLKLGNESHHEMLLEGIDSLNDIGCFGLTELGVGNNAVMMTTTANYDQATDEFIINTPSPLAQKYWITNGALHAKHIVVFAQLNKADGKNEGVHAFLVRMRNNDMSTCEGVTIEDMGHRMGLNGVDNAKISFDNVRIPRTNLLDAHSQMDAEGNFDSSIKSTRGRFLKVADQLLSGRICIAAMAMGAAKASLAIALRYSQTRLTVGKSGLSDTQILSYQLQKRALMPLLTRTIVLGFGLDHTKRNWNGEEGNPENVVPAVCALKPLCSWNLERVASITRERCGGAGYLSCSRFGTFIGLAHAAMTAEGDNSVLMQKVAKERLPLIAKEDHSYNDKLHLKTNKLFLLLKHREMAQFLKLGKVLQGTTSDTMFETWMNQESDLVQSCGKSYGERLSAEATLDLIEKNPELAPILDPIVNQYMCDIIEKDCGTFLSLGLMSIDEYNNIVTRSQKLCEELSGQCMNVIEAFNIPDELLSAPIALDWNKFNSYDNQGEVSDKVDINY